MDGARKRWVLALLLPVLAALFKIWRRKGGKLPVPDQVAKLWWMLCPFGKTRKELEQDPNATAGRIECVLITLTSILSTWHANRMVYVRSEVVRAAYHRDVVLFKRVIVETMLMSALSAVIHAAHRYLKERCALVWRDRLTEILRRRYFSAMSYYKLSHLNAGKMSDVEERFVEDPERFAWDLAEEVEKVSTAFTSGAWFTYKLTSLTNPIFALAPLIYYYAAWRVNVLLTPGPADWMRIGGTWHHLRSVYYGSQRRLQSHAEAICAYQGNDAERSIIEKSMDAWLESGKSLNQLISKAMLVGDILFHRLGGSLAQLLVVGRSVGQGAAAKRRYNEIMAAGGAASDKAAAEAVGSVFTDMSVVGELFGRCQMSQGAVIGAIHHMREMAARANRITEFMGVLDEFGRKHMTDATFVDDAKVIAFENVQVYTPTGQLLLKDLNFRIEHGMNMLLTGCNGSGKSSIFRCLGGLWNVKEGGRITKPGGNAAGLNAAVFYLPQKPYNVIGTLRQQICYPASAERAAGISDAELAALLGEVDLQYLLERGPQGPKDDKEVKWESVLSLGEKQRLAVARLFYHRPRFAILDECTSAVSSSMERRLYDKCAERDITCVTISHRPVLEQYHDCVLCVLKDGEGGWTWRVTNANRTRLGAGGGPRAALSPDRCRGGAEEEMARLRRRSEKYRAPGAGGESFTFDVGGNAEKPRRSVWRRFRDVWQHFMPDGFSPRDPETWRFAGLFSLVIAKTLAADAVAVFDGATPTLALRSDMTAFYRAVARGAVMRCALAGCDIGVHKMRMDQRRVWRRRLLMHMHDKYFTGRTFYDVKNRDGRIADPEERITEQMWQLSEALSDLWTNMSKPAFDIVYNTVQLHRVVGPGAVLGVVGYMSFAGAAACLVVPNHRANQAEAEELKGKLRDAHARVKEHTESIAFFGGGDVESRAVTSLWEDLRAQVARSNLESLRYNAFHNFTIRQTPAILSFWLRMTFAQRNFATDRAIALDAGELQSVSRYVQETVSRSFNSFGEAFDLIPNIGKFTGTLDRVTDLMYVIEDLAAKQAKSQAGDAGLTPRPQAGFGKLAASSEDQILFDGIDIVAPGGTCCAAGVSFAVRRGHPVMVTGPNASGKSSLFRVLGGLWPIPCGRIERPCDAAGAMTPKDVFLVPQKPYSVVGSLADQVTYPDRVAKGARSAEVEKKLLELLTLVRIEYLAEREYHGKKGWDVVQTWEDVLSFGEQQRMGLARLFYHAPAFAVLDECTSAVSIDVEEALYRAARDRGITSLTCSQRLALEEFHDSELRLGDANGEEGWALRGIREAP